MKLRTCLTALCLSTAAMSGAVDIYKAFGLADHGFGSRSRHIISWGRTMAVAAGEVNDATGMIHAAAWPHVTNTGGGTLCELPSPNPMASSTAGSAAMLADGRYGFVGQWTDLGNVKRAVVWVNTLANPETYIGTELPDVSGSTGSEALDISALPNGGAIVVGSRWPNAKWMASVWFVSPAGVAQGMMLPTPAGSGWSIANSVSNPLGNGTCVIVGQSQNTLGGNWRACVWRLNLVNGQAQFSYMDDPTRDSYGYRVDPKGQFAVGWRERDEVEFGSMWRLRQGFPNVTLSQNSRIYGVNSHGYMCGWWTAVGVNIKDGLISHASYVGDQGFNLIDLLSDPTGWDRYFHLLCIAEDGFTTGCGMSADYAGGSDKMHAIVGAPTGNHGFDTADIRKGFSLGGDSGSLFRVDDVSLAIRAQQKRAVLDLATLSVPQSATSAQLALTLGALDSDPTRASILIFNWPANEFVDTGMSYDFTAGNTSHTFGWSTFPSDFRSATGEVRIRLVFETTGRRDTINVDAATLHAN